MDRDTILNELNAFLKGEEMAIEAYERFIGNLKDEAVRNEFIKIQKDHKKHAEQIADRIHALNGTAKHGTGLAGFMADIKNSIQRPAEDTEEILKHAYDGEDKGIAKASEIVKGDLDSESRELINGIISEDHAHLETISNIISDFRSRN